MEARNESNVNIGWDKLDQPYGPTRQRKKVSTRAPVFHCIHSFLNRSYYVLMELAINFLVGGVEVSKNSYGDTNLGWQVPAPIAIF